MLLAKIFKNHYNKTYAYILDVLGLAFAIKVLLQLNGATVIINQYQDLAVYGVLAILGIRLMGGYSMMLRFTSLLDVSRIAAGLFIATILFGFYTGATTRLEFRYLVLLFYFSITVLVAYRVGISALVPPIYCSNRENPHPVIWSGHQRFKRPEGAHEFQ
jgi:FlaA1/EpsC-like NDP-sugar epimerase